MRTATTAQPEATRLFTPTRSPLLQRKCDCGNAAGLTGNCSECQKKNLTLQRRSTDQAEVSEVPPIVHEVLRSPGQPLDRETRSVMESRFGHDFSQVRVHTDGKSAQSARLVNALAYTVGKDVVFASGRYMPQTTTGKKVLAHELTHVLQQGSMSNPAIATLKVGSSNDFYEQEAEAQAEKVVSTDEAIAPATPRHAPAMQRLGDLTKVPPGLSCPVATSSAPETDHILFPNRGVTLSPLQQAQIENVVRNWWATGASAPVRVDGFASQVGADELNWQLSCDRAQAVVAELRSPTSGAVSGIPASFITIFAQGETTEFGSDAQNRRVTIEAPLPAPPPAPPTPTPTTPTLKRTVTISPTNYGCGGFTMAARWGLDNADSTTNGFIVQKLTFDLNREICTGGRNDFQKTYWEAWQVRGGVIHIGTSSSPHNADTFTVPSTPDHEGSTYEVGKAKFIPNYIEPLSWGNVPEARSLPATTSQPAGWSDAGTLDRWIGNSSFDCCNQSDLGDFYHQA
jgi:outer membrane protein OmpA-like peptidoglycan-associated protein